MSGFVQKVIRLGPSNNFSNRYGLSLFVLYNCICVPLPGKNGFSQLPEVKLINQINYEQTE